ncbi:MAG: hypothetical protein GXP52_01780 [Deltaproteobacteria bacterium]|nr:hypothetical protein [Deltaproteobacteria bacterium]
MSINRKTGQSLVETIVVTTLVAMGIVALSTGISGVFEKSLRTIITLISSPIP